MHSIHEMNCTRNSASSEAGGELGRFLNSTGILFFWMGAVGSTFNVNGLGSRKVCVLFYNMYVQYARIQYARIQQRIE